MTPVLNQSCIYDLTYQLVYVHSRLHMSRICNMSIRQNERQIGQIYNASVALRQESQLLPVLFG